jgi:hypothetical protein
MNAPVNDLLLDALENIRQFLLYPSPECVTECRHLTEEGTLLIVNKIRALTALAAPISAAPASPSPTEVVGRREKIASVLDRFFERDWPCFDELADAIIASLAE